MSDTRTSAAGPASSLDSFGARSVLETDAGQVGYYDLGALERAGLGRLDRLPYAIRILLENLVRHEDGETVTAEDIRFLASWPDHRGEEREISFRPSRVLLQDFTGVPAVVDLAAMRDAMEELGGEAGSINPLLPAELVIDHSVQVDSFGRAASFQINAEKEFERNRERYAFLRWGQRAFEDFRVVPPDTGIVHQVNLEYLARVVFGPEDGSGELAYPDTLVGTDSHTTMINGLGVLGWGVGGIEAEAGMLGQPISLLVPDVVGFRLTGRLSEGATATDLVLRVTEMLREHGVVGKFVEFFGDGLPGLSLADRATLGNMSPEYGATCAISPIDRETLDYLRFTGRPEERVALVEAYARAQGLFHEPGGPEAEYSSTLELDLSTVEPSLAGPKLPQERIALSGAAEAFDRAYEELVPLPADDEDGADAPEQLSRWKGEGGDGGGGGGLATRRAARKSAEVTLPAGTDGDHGEQTIELSDGSVVIAAITSCTNTSNPSVMVAAGLLARNAARRGMTRKPWVKTSLAPGSQVVTEYLEEADLMDDLEALGFNLVGYGCTTCIGNSGPLPEPISRAIRENGLVACSVLSGNRNFEGRINPDTRANYLASPPLVVAYALAGRMDIDLTTDPLGEDEDGEPVYLRDIWPSQEEIRETIRRAVKTEMFRKTYADVFSGTEKWTELDVPDGERFAWDPDSTYVRQPPFFQGLPPRPPEPADVHGARALAVVGDSVTTDHISPAGSIAKDSPAADYLRAHGVSLAEFNSYGARRGNHEVMMRGTFANIRLRNRMVPGIEGGYTVHLPDGQQTTIFEAAERYREEGVPLLVLAGEQYGTGSSRDWAAKGPALLGVKVVIAESYERIHRSNLIGMGVLPLQFLSGEGAGELGLDGTEVYDVEGIAAGLEPGAQVTVRATPADGDPIEFGARVRLDTRVEVDYWRNGGILQMVLRRMAPGASPEA
ncbi:MAG TPA: aconitate hydratase [Gemmatimonadota bacterium]|nr:aconitate hydratase [Gemmatimonadota bacterium]